MRKRILTEVVCVDCNKSRLIEQSAYKGIKPLRCRSCANKARYGANNPAWKGGRINSHSHGYIRIRLLHGDFFSPMASEQGYVFEHRLVMAKHLGRCLLPWEVVHHKGTKYPSGSIENRGDNRMENLELLPSNKYHLIDSAVKAYIRKLELKVKHLENELEPFRCHPRPK